MESPATYSIGREISDVTADVVAAGPPVVPTVPAGGFRLRAVDPAGDDLQMLAEWFGRPHLVDSWEQEWSVEQWRADSRHRLAGDYSRPLILTLDDSAVGYIELYRVARDEIARLYPVHPHDMGIHVATAETSLLGRGVISGWIADVTEQVFAADAECRRMVAEPGADNARMRRALTKRGWTDLGEFDIRPDRRIALHIKGRTPADVPRLD